MVGVFDLRKLGLSSEDAHGARSALANTGPFVSSERESQRTAVPGARGRPQGHGPTETLLSSVGSKDVVVVDAHFKTFPAGTSLLDRSRARDHEKGASSIT